MFLNNLVPFKATGFVGVRLNKFEEIRISAKATITHDVNSALAKKASEPRLTKVSIDAECATKQLSRKHVLPPRALATLSEF